MVIAMFLAHLVGDYVLQWDRLAFWKSREVKGAAAHGLIVTVVTVLFALPFDPGWWPWALFIGVGHIAVDALQPLLMRRLPQPTASRLALPRYVIDQAVHFAIILFALVASGYLTPSAIATELMALLRENRLMAFLLGYTFISMPTWILVEFLVYGLMKGSAPDFTQVPNKYVGSLERGLITTFVLLGQFSLAPLAALPRLVLEAPQVAGTQRATLYVAELLANVLLAVVIGLALRAL